MKDSKRRASRAAQRFTIALLLLQVIGCGDDDTSPSPDAGAGSDAGARADGATGTDAGPFDGGGGGGSDAGPTTSGTWAGILSPIRAVDWTTAGTAIPARSTVCAMLSPGATASEINAAIAACDDGVVLLAAGDYALSSGITFGDNTNVTLRGAGANRTLLTFSNDASCNGLPSDVCIAGSNSSPGGEQQSADWTAGYARGATSLTLSNSRGITANSTLISLDQLDETADTAEVWNCSETGACSNSGTGGFARGGDRSQQQQVLVTACSPSCDSDGPTTVTISPGLYMANWTAAKSPQAWWANETTTGNGIEDVSLDHSATGSGVVVMNCFGCWVKGVRSIRSGRNHVWLYQASHSVVRDSYFYENVTHASVSYGIEVSPSSSDNLLENNIFDRTTDSNPNTNGGSAGNVAAYNFTAATRYVGAGWFQASDYEHGSGNGYWLREGNQGLGFTADNVHGNHHLTTLFRNYYTGWQADCGGEACSAQTVPVHLYGGTRITNVVGNVLGRSGYHDQYESIAPSGMNGNTAIFTLGWTGNGGSTDSSITGFCADATCASHVDYDPFTATTLLRWGNYDAVTADARFEASEIPTGAGTYASPVPATHTLPASFYLPGRPAWWAPSIPFPANGPDVTGGDIPGTGGHANKIPAAVCYESTSSTGGVLDFNAADCYAP